MRQYENYQDLISAFKSACNLLNLDHTSQLHQDIIAIFHHLTNPNLRIAVFGPFNHGKSTLLNAILGNRTLPIDLIPTTGAAITIKYGADVHTRIIFIDGTEIYRSGTEILQQFAVLDGDRQMRKDVASVEIFCPHPLLATGVEFVDLPGTNDREAQDNLVKEQLLGADIVIQLLDARKLMTLGERENLRDWLLDRGITTVIFVANFINLLEPHDQLQVQNRLRFVAESFRAELPTGFSNLYRVDALPALRARLKGDVAAATSSGLVAFEAALQNIVTILQQNRQDVRLPRVQAIASQIQLLLKAKIDPILNEIQAFNHKQKAKIEIKQKAQNLIQTGFTSSVSELRDWLALPNLLNKYQPEATVALAENNFKTWQTDVFKKDLMQLQLAVVKWLYQAYDFFQGERPEDLLIPLPQAPQITLPPKLSNIHDLSEPGAIAMGGGIGWLLAGPVGAAVVGSISYLLNKNLQNSEEKINQESYDQQVAKICITATKEYFTSFSNQGLSILNEYVEKAEKVIHFEISQEPLEITQRRENLQQLQNSFNQLLRELEKAKIPANYPPEQVTQKYTYSQTKTSPPKEQNSRDKSTAANNPSSSSPPLKPEELTAKFRNWELDEEIAQMKAQMHSPGASTQQQTPPNNQAQNPLKTIVDKDKIAHAYSILGLQPGVSFAEVKQAYKILVKKWHPDLFINQPQMQQQAQEKMRLINEAYRILSTKKDEV
ncbi:dynamin family protein [Fortiea contorta]|uniref:dynamin family protein n=1 Tax=Fortiea contorta TaxID=1892405 RepID=UPI00034AB909|nr:dynamin family protein [Fortiea contorta]